MSVAEDAPFVVCSMFTDSFADKAGRLADSAQDFGLSHAIFQVPGVHRSISVNGNDDLTFCKPRFIRWALGHFGRPVLYVDADCRIGQWPEFVFDLAKNGVDFAIYNWFFDLANDAWRPFEGAKGETFNGAPRYWRFDNSVDLYASDQLFCSGAVQYWAASPAAIGLTEAWERALVGFPKAADDECLDYAFNLDPPTGFSLKSFWLPKEYARYGFWIHVRPIIDHPDLPAAVNSAHFEALGTRRIDPARLIEADKARPLPRTAILDAKTAMLLMPDPTGSLLPATPVPMPLWITC